MAGNRKGGRPIVDEELKDLAPKKKQLIVRFVCSKCGHAWNVYREKPDPKFEPSTYAATCSDCLNKMTFQRFKEGTGFRLKRFG